MLFGSGANLTITNSVLRGNDATGALPDAGWGGAILMFGVMNVNIQGTDLFDNTAFLGGAIHNRFAGASLTVNGSQLHDNFGFQNGGAVYTISGSTTITNSSLTHNRVGLAGQPGVHQYYGG